MEDSLVRSECGRPRRVGAYSFMTAESGLARHTLGLLLLLCVVFLWTTSNFLGSSIFADGTYAKPFFITYIGTSVFVVCLIPGVWRIISAEYRDGRLSPRGLWQGLRANELSVVDDEEEEEEESGTFLIKPVAVDKPTYSRSVSFLGTAEALPVLPTARLALTFCILWFLANYFSLSCLRFTTVASATVLTSTSSMWTLLMGAITRTEPFTWRKLCGVVSGLVGITIISQVDLGGDNGSSDERRRGSNKSTFPDKLPWELALGDGLALLSAVLYGLYTITLKKTTIRAAPREIHMPTFFGFVGLFNALLLWPFFLILHFTGLEPFALPPTSKIWAVLSFNSLINLLSDIAWAYAMIFTSPIVATVGLSLTIPLSLIGEMIIQKRFESWWYWLGAFIVVGSFVFVERAEKEELVGDIRAAAEEEEEEPGSSIDHNQDVLLLEQDTNDDHHHRLS